MRKLVNNWLFGEVSPLFTGRLDTDIYSAGCSRLENMYVHRQGGISRRPPLKVKFTDPLIQYADRIIPFVVSADESYLVLLGDGKVIIYNGSEFSQLSIQNPSQEVQALWNTTWGTLTRDELRKVRFANYYNDLYLVHKKCPLLRIRNTGSGVFTLQLPTLKVNQDVTKYSTFLDIDSSHYSSSGAVNYMVYVEGRGYALAKASGDSYSVFLDKICAIEYDGWTATRATGSHNIKFEPSEKWKKYAEYKLATSSSSASDLADADFKITNNATLDIVYEFEREHDTNEMGIVYGQDEPKKMYLNTAGNYASDIDIISERMWLVVNGNPCRVYVSRPYATSQIIHPQESNDTILDFIQYQVVTSTDKLMKDEADLPVTVFYDPTSTSQAPLYQGTTYDQWLWKYSGESTADWTMQDYQNALALRKCTITYDSQPDYEGGEAYRRPVKIVPPDGSFEIDYSIIFHYTTDEEVNYTKLKKEANGDYYSDVYKWNNNGTFTNITVAEPTAETKHGLVYRYFKTDDVYINSKTTYFTLSGSTYTKVTTASQEHIDEYYEREVKFTSDYKTVVYEKSGVYVESLSPTIPLDVTYDEVNGRILRIEHNGDIYAEAIPYYQYDLTTESEIYEEETKVDRVATESTGMDLQLASGRNDYISWVALGDWIIVGTESSEWRMEIDINALSGGASCYSSYGSTNGLVTYVGTDIVFLQKDNRLRLFYKDNWGLQNLEVTLTNPDIMKGEILNMIGTLEPEPSMVILKKENGVTSIVFVSIDRANSVQAFARWTFLDAQGGLYVLPIDIATFEENGSQKILVLLEEDNTKFIAEIDNTEALHFTDCGVYYFPTEDTTITQGKTYYAKNGDTYEETTPTSNPKTEGLYEYGPTNYVHGYRSIMTALPFDTQTQDGSVTLGEAKNVSKIVFRCLDTGKVVYHHGNNVKDRTISRTPICCNTSGQYVGGLADFSMNVNGGTTKDLEISVESYEDQPMTLLAMAYELRVNRNDNRQF